MLATLLLASAAANQFPLLTALSKELWGLAIALFGTGLTLYFFYHKERKEKRQELVKKLAEDKTAEDAWKKKMEDSVKSFMPEGSIREAIAKVDHATGENKIAIGQVSAAAEKGVNALHEEVSAMKMQMATFVGMPSELNNTKLEVKLLASEFKNVVSKVDNIQQEMRTQGEKHERTSKEHYDRLAASIERLSDQVVNQVEKNAETRGRVNKQ